MLLAIVRKCDDIGMSPDPHSVTRGTVCHNARIPQGSWISRGPRCFGLCPHSHSISRWGECGALQTSLLSPNQHWPVWPTIMQCNCKAVGHRLYSGSGL